MRFSAMQRVGIGRSAATLARRTARSRAAGATATQRRGRAVRRPPARAFWGSSAGAPAVCTSFSEVRDQYDLGRELGAGTYATVYQATEKTTGDDHAVKAIEKERADTPMLKNEIAILMKIAGSPECMDLKGVFEDSRFLWLASSRYTGGELFDAIVSRIDRGELYTEVHAATVTRQVLEALAHCHLNGVIHRDIKPENILLKGDAESMDVVLVDFGIAKEFRVRGTRQTECIGSYAFMAPEVAKSNYDERADAWSVGVVLYIMLCGEMPFSGATDDEMLASVSVGRYVMDQPVWSTISDECKAVVTGLMERDPQKRLTVEAALECPWVAGSGLGRSHDIGANVVAPLREWMSARAFDKAVIGVVAGILEAAPSDSGEELAEIREAFAAVDADGSGQLNPKEFREAIAQLKGPSAMTDGDITALFDSVDTDHSGKIDMHEFIRAALGKPRLVLSSLHSYYSIRISQ